MTQNLLTNSIFANLDITSTGDSIIVNNEELGVDACIHSKYLVPQGSGVASCSTYQTRGLGEEGLNGLYEKWRNRLFKQIKDGFEAVMTGRTNASFE
ncbi:hypothetical protein I204_02581 [Kwoniella mangroviensis CBS 8886]|nr:hypothetical protein I204_02581 [Kwoniella mangroviensis CBS 8886]